MHMARLLEGLEGGCGVVDAYGCMGLCSGLACGGHISFHSRHAANWTACLFRLQPNARLAGRWKSWVSRSTEGRSSLAFDMCLPSAKWHCACLLY